VQRKVHDAMTVIYLGGLFTGLLCSALGEYTTLLLQIQAVKKVKVAHTRLPSVGSGADPGSLQSACR